MVKFPNKLKKGDRIEVISPSRSFSLIPQEARKRALKFLEGMGLKVSFSRYSSVQNRFDSSSVEERIEDLHRAFENPDVKGIVASIGGWNSNQILNHIDYELIANNSKIFCGFSDITALGNAFLSRSNLVTYSGPTFSRLSDCTSGDYTLQHLHSCFFYDTPIEIRPSNVVIDRNFSKPNFGPYVINQGQASGRIVGGNLSTVNLLQGTPYAPDLNACVVLIEDDYEVLPHTFDRDLQSLLHLPSANGINGMLIGRFENSSKMTKDVLSEIIDGKKELQNVPVIADVDFGHTMPMFTFPIGGEISITTEPLNIVIYKH